MCINIFKNLKATRLLVLFIIFYGITVKTRLLQGSETSETRLLKARGALTTSTIGKVGFQSKQWNCCCPNHSVAYKAKVRGTLGPCNRRVSRLAINGS